MRERAYRTLHAAHHTVGHQTAKDHDDRNAGTTTGRVSTDGAPMCPEKAPSRTISLASELIVML
jgi:hypothetical protein